MPSRIRRAAAVLAAAAATAVLAGLLAPAAPAAAAAPLVHVELLDPLMTEPAQVLVQVAAADGSAAPFSGTVSLAVGKRSVTAPVTGGADGTAVVEVATTALPGGEATMTARISAGGGTRRVVRTHFLTVVPQVEVAGFGCAAVPRAGGVVRWAVTRLAGAPVRTPDSRDLPLLPYVRDSLRRWSMTGPDGLPLATSGTVTVLRGGRAVATVKLGTAVRRLVFGTRLRGGLAAGAYTARLRLVDPSGRVATAEQPVAVVAAGTMPCSA